VGFLTGALQTDTVGIIIYLDPAFTGTLELPAGLEGAQAEIRRGRFASPFEDAADQEEFSAPPQGTTPPALSDNPRDKTFEPMIGGISVNPDFWYVNSWQGTLGLTIADESGRPVILSNRHVICGKKPKAGDGVSQPSYEFLSHLSARLLKWQLGDVTYEGEKYGIDAAIALPIEGRTARIGAILDLTPVSGSEDPVLGMGVAKSGLTTAVTYGRVTDIDVDVRGEDQMILSKQIVIKANDDLPFAKSGHSGSVVVNLGSNKVIGLLWGGTDDKKEAIASPIKPVLDYFGCTIP
jgi:hypothetical protein